MARSGYNKTIFAAPMSRRLVRKKLRLYINRTNITIEYFCAMLAIPVEAGKDLLETKRIDKAMFMQVSDYLKNTKV